MFNGTFANRGQKKRTEGTLVRFEYISKLKQTRFSTAEPNLRNENSVL